MGMCIIIPNVIYKIGELNDEEMFEYDEHERDPLTLLSAPKLFEYMKYANGAVDIDFGE